MTGVGALCLPLPHHHGLGPSSVAVDFGPPTDVAFVAAHGVAAPRCPAVAPLQACRLSHRHSCTAVLSVPLSPRRLRRSGDTAQRTAEPAWHRRRRRARGAARALLRVAAASRLLAGHHSAQRPATNAMPAGARGGNGGQRGGGHVARLEAKVAELEERLTKAYGGQGSGGGGGARGVGGAGRGEEEIRGRGGYKHAEARPGDWRCRHCHAYPCFARARRCYKCGEPKSALGDLSAPRNGSAYLGPVGAGGARPMLGGRAWSRPTAGGQEAHAGRAASPTIRVPGASVAAAAEAERRRVQLGRSAMGSVHARDGGGALQPARGGAAPAANAPGPVPGGGERQAASSTIATRNSWAALSEEDEEDGGDDMETDGPQVQQTTKAGTDDGDDGLGDADGACEADQDDGGEGEEQEAIGAGELRKAWEDHCNTCRFMERSAHGFPPKLLEEARALRDEAERQWRAAKRPQPLHKRLRWAEGALREAEAKEDAQRQELRRHIEEAQQRQREIEGRVAVSAARTARKRAALDAVRLEASPRMSIQASERAARMAATGIASDVAPSLAAVIERLAAPLGEDVETIRQELQLVAVSLSRVEGVLREGAETNDGNGRPARYDISGDMSGDLDGEGGGCGFGRDEGDDGDERDAKVRRSEHSTATRWAKQTQHGVWRKNGSMSSVGAAEAARRLLEKHTTGERAVEAGAAATGAAVQALRGSDTNDLAEAARRDAQAAEQQVQEAHRNMQANKGDQRLQQEEEQRQQRQRDQQEELRRHQAAMQQAAQQRAAEEAQQREALIASMSPQELARAMELHAQQATIGAQIFGTQTASQLAEMVQKAEAQRAEQAEVQRIMETSQEELLALQGGDNGACPW